MQANDPDTPRVEEAMLRYPGWEAELRLFVVGPGRLDLGVYSVIDIHKGSVEVGELSGVTAGQTA